MEPFFCPPYYPSRFYGSEPPVLSHDWMLDMGSWYDGRMQPFAHPPFGYHRQVHYPVATRQGREDGIIRGDVFTPLRSRAASVRLPFQQLFDDKLFGSGLADDVICLLEQHSQKLDEANKTSGEGLKTSANEDSSVVSTSSENVDLTKPSTSSAEPTSKESSRSGEDVRKEIAEKKRANPCDGYMLQFERSPHGLYRPVYSPVSLRRKQGSAPVKQLLDDDFFKSVFTDDLLSLLEHHVSEADDAYRGESGTTATDASSSEGAVARKEDNDQSSKPFNVSLKLGDFHPENVHVSLDGRKVIVKAKREEHGDDDSWKRHSHVEYSFSLPEETPAESLTTSFNTDGILSITAEKDDASNKALKGSSEKQGETEQKKEEEYKQAVGADNNEEK
ncbi:uncharacterized protein LOC115919133 isoform X1 [Strongylocentrotus purpuratus]|uniref:SHSP domain-containing protein n=1 Tax=Strongylocentrotus purpuratus TaxID=7668 RepID=A0A7M7MX92_STRPU|nr:uncharacterized protein LOC115919133 isoform X1 [Strongylocentrotus purpuratus]